jgi:soluble lytic murein transglycosylase-like protein
MSTKTILQLVLVAAALVLLFLLLAPLTARADQASRDNLKKIQTIAATQRPLDGPRLSVIPRERVEEPLPSYTITEWVTMRAEDAHLDPSHVVRIMKCESGGNPQAKNAHSSASGLFQFMPDTFRSVSLQAGHPEWDIWNAADNTSAAIWLMVHSGFGAWSCK